MDDDVYDALFSVLSEAKSLSDWPKNSDKGLRQRVYRKWKSNMYVLKEIHNPAAGKLERRIVERATNCIVIKKSEVAQLVDSAYEETKGEGAEKLRNHMSQLYCGLSRRIIQRNLNSMKQQQKVRPLFQNKAPLRPIKASRVQERHQVDLVSMISMPATIEGDTYKYIMSVIDIFSRFLFLRPLQSKEANEVAEHLLDIYIEHGPPDILQSDQGPEFKGVVKTICESLNVRIIRSAAYSPQTQGKDERSHRTWKEKIKFDLLKVNGDLNWAEYLQQYQQLYNESPHSSLGGLSPFEVYFGRKPNRQRNKLHLGGKKDFEVPEENQSEGRVQANEYDRDETHLREIETQRDLIREKALDASNKAAQRMVKRELKRKPPSLYYKGETVLIRVPESKKLVKGKKNSFRSNCEGVILEADHALHKYRIEYKDPSTLKSRKGWFKVDDVTSVTKEEENERQRIAQAKSRGKRNATDHGGSPGKPIKRVRIDNASLLEASIDQIMSSRKLNGDTVNLYFEFLRNNQAIGEGNWGFVSSYFYPSLQRPVEKTNYSKHIGNKSLWEYEELLVPVHLPSEKHWLLVLISVLNLCLYIYDSASCTAATYRTVFNTIKERFIKNELQWLSDKDKALFQEGNWQESTPKCPKQTNNTDCGVFTCLFAKHLMFSSGNSQGLVLDDDPRSEMASDLLNLASALNSANDLPEVFKWMAGDTQTLNASESPKCRLDKEVSNAGLSYRQPPTPKDGNCLFHAISDQLIRLGMAPQSPAALRSSMVEYLRNNPTTPDAYHFRDFVNHGAWEMYLRRMAMDGEWGDWIALWGLINMLNIPVAIVSSLGEEGLNIIYPAGCEGKDDLRPGGMALLGHEAELHYHSLEAMDFTSHSNVQNSIVTELKRKYGEGKVSEEICPNCGKKFQCYSQGVFESGGALQVYSDDSVYCDVCQLHAEL